MFLSMISTCECIAINYLGDYPHNRYEHTLVDDTHYNCMVCAKVYSKYYVRAAYHTQGQTSTNDYTVYTLSLSYRLGSLLLYHGCLFGLYYIAIRPVVQYVTNTA